MSKPKAIIFDADGTLFDSFELIMAAYTHVAQTHDLRVPSSAEIRVQMGKPLPEIFATLYPDFDLSTLLSTNDTFVAANAMKAEAFEGIQDLLKYLVSRDLKLAILTSGSQKIHKMLEHHGVDRYFSSVVYHERVQNYKPHPEGFLLACKECGVDPTSAIMVGDTTVDINTGKNAHAYATIALTHGYGLPEDLKNAQPDYTVDSLTEVKAVLSSVLE